MQTDQQRITEARREVAEQWKEDTDKLLSAFQNDDTWRDIIDDLLDKLYGSNNNQSLIHKHMQLVDFVRFIVDELSTVHETSAEHTLLDPNGEPVPTDDPKWDTYQQLLKDTRYDDITKQSEEWANLLNCCTISLTPDFPGQTFKMALVEATELVVIQDPIFYDVLDKCRQLAIRIASNTGTVEGRPDSEEQYIVYTRHQTDDINADQIEAWITNNTFDPVSPQPSGIEKYPEYITSYPVVHVQPKAPRRGDLFRKVPQDLLTITQEVIWRMISRQYMIWSKQQEPYTTSTTEESFSGGNAPNPSSTPMSIIFGVDNMTPLSWSPNTNDYTEDMRVVLQTFAQARGLSKSFQTDVSAPESGVSKFWDEKERIERRLKASVYYADIEDNQLFPKMVEMAIMVEYPGAKDLEGCTQKTFWPDPISEVSPKEQRDLDEADMRLGQLTPLMLFMRENELDIDDARKKMKEFGLPETLETGMLDRVFSGDTTEDQA